MKRMPTRKIFLAALFLNILFAVTVHAQYCTPSYGSGCSLGDDINSFTLTGASSSISDLGTGCSSTGYDDRTGVVAAVTLMPGGVYSGTVNAEGFAGSTFSVDGIEIYIDFNNDFVFAASESVGGVNSIDAMPTTTPFTINIPAGATLGSHRMRVIMADDGDATYPGIDPCATTTIAPPPFPPFPYSYGEAHDYLVTIVGLSTACPAPTGVTASSITSSSATISWTAATGAIGYEWAVTTSVTPPASGTATTLTTANATGLTASTVYYAHVRTKCAATTFSAWTTYTFTTTGTTTTCPPVTGLTMSSITASSAILNWTAATGAVGYEWAVTTSATPPGSGTATTLTTATASGLTASTAYYAHVRTNCGTTFSTWVTTPFTTSSTSCPAITGLAASAITTTSATVSWTAVTSGSLGYQYVINNTVTDPTGSGANTTATSTSPTGLTPGTTYYAHVRDSCGVGSFSAWSTIPFTTLSTTCNAPTGLAASAITSNSATLSWTNATGAVGAQYVVNIIPADPTASGTPTTATSVPITGLTASTTYYAHVRDSCGATALSAWVTIPFTTLGSAGISYANNSKMPFGITVYPNPVREVLTVLVNGNISGSASIQVIDITGKLLKTAAVDAGTITIEMGGLPQGVYLVRYIDTEHTQTVRATKE